jgi:hypothetical protein
MLNGAHGCDVAIKNPTAYVPMKMTIECEVKINPTINAPCALELRVPDNSTPRVKVEFPDTPRGKRGQVELCTLTTDRRENGNEGEVFE